MNLDGKRVQPRQVLIHHTAGCHDCSASVASRNAQVWASNHVKANPTHHVEVTLGYSVRAE